MRKLMFWSEQHPIFIVFSIFLITILSSYAITFIKVDVSVKGMMMHQDPEIQAYKEVVEKFGTDNISIVFVSDKNLFTPRKLKLLEKLINSLEKINYVKKIESIFSVTNITSEDNILSIGPLIDSIPDTLEEAESIKTDALQNPMVLNYFLSKDATSTAINLILDPEYANPETFYETSKKINDIINKSEFRFEKIFQVGESFNKLIMKRYIIDDLKTFIPICIIFLLFTLIIILKSISSAILPVLTLGITIIWTFGFMSVCGIPLNILMVIIPTLIIVIGSAENIHMLSEFIEGFKFTGIKSKAVHYMSGKCGTAILLTSVTSLLCFLSITLNKIVFLKQFGIVSSFGLFVNPLITFTLGPVYLRFLGPSKLNSNKKTGKKVIDKVMDNLAKWIIHTINTNKWLVFTIIISFAIIMGFFASLIKIDNDINGIFRKSSPVRINGEILHKHIAGSNVFNICISSGFPGTFKQSENLLQISMLQQFLKGSDKFDKSISLADYLAFIHKEFNGGDKNYFKIPESQGMIAQYLLLLQHDEISRFVTPDYSEANILVRHNLISSHEISKAIKELKKYLDKNLHTHFKYSITGENILVNSAAATLIDGQIRSFLFFILLVFIIMSFVFVNLKAGALALIPHIFPIVVIFGIMGLFGIPLNIGTSIVIAVGFGIAADNTIHLMTRYTKEMREKQDQIKSLETVIRSEISLMVISAIALATLLMVTCFSDLLPVVDFSLLSAIIILMSLIGDLFLTTFILSSTQLITIWDLVGLNVKDAVLKESKIFKGLMPWQIKKVILLGKVLQKNENELAVSYGEYGSSMYLLLEGCAKVLAINEKDKREVVVATLIPGDIFGEIALVEPGPRSANIMSADYIVYLEIDWGALKRIQRIFPRIAARLYLNLAIILGGRLVNTNKLLLAEKAKSA